MTLIELQEMLFTFMCSMGATQLSESTKTNFQWKLEVEFGYLLQYKDLLDNSKLFIVPNNLSKLSLARDVAQLSQELKKKTCHLESKKSKRLAFYFKKQFVQLRQNIHGFQIRHTFARVQLIFRMNLKPFLIPCCLEKLAIQRNAQAQCTALSTHLGKVSYMMWVEVTKSH